jgi:hypothetical protein
MGAAAALQGEDEGGAGGQTVQQASNGNRAGAAERRSQQEEDEDIDLGPGMFDEDAAGMMNLPAQEGSQKGGIAGMLAPWGEGYSGPQKKKGGPKLKSENALTNQRADKLVVLIKGDCNALQSFSCTIDQLTGKQRGVEPVTASYVRQLSMHVVPGGLAEPEPVQETRLPKALLQQWCARAAAPPPRFERLPVGGQRLPTAGTRYSATLEPAPASGPARKKKARSEHSYPVTWASLYSHDVPS